MEFVFNFYPSRANSAIGYETVKALAASDQAYHILVGCRSIDNGNKAISSVQKEIPNTASSFSTVQVDVSSDDSIQKAFEQVKAGPGRVDTLINNAGMLQSVIEARIVHDIPFKSSSYLLSSPKNGQARR